MNMTDTILRNCHILVVEDEYMIADEFCAELKEAGAVVAGPVATVEDALAIIDAIPELNGVVLDVKLCGEMSFAVADRLLWDGIPFIFATGYDASSIPSRFGCIVRCEKPVSVSKVLKAIGQAVHS